MPTLRSGLQFSDVPCAAQLVRMFVVYKLDVFIRLILCLAACCAIRSKRLCGCDLSLNLIHSSSSQTPQNPQCINSSHYVVRSDALSSHGGASDDLLPKTLLLRSEHVVLQRRGVRCREGCTPLLEVGACAPLARYYKVVRGHCCVIAGVMELPLQSGCQGRTRVLIATRVL